MEKFPRGTLPPYAWVPIVTAEPAKVAPAPSTTERGQAVESSKAPRGTCDLSVTCPTCTTMMQPEHAHYRCLTCGYRDSCCF